MYLFTVWRHKRQSVGKNVTLLFVLMKKCQIVSIMAVYAEYIKTAENRRIKAVGLFSGLNACRRRSRFWC